VRLAVVRLVAVRFFAVVDVAVADLRAAGRLAVVAGFAIRASPFWGDLRSFRRVSASSAAADTHPVFSRVATSKKVVLVVSRRGLHLGVALAAALLVIAGVIQLEEQAAAARGAQVRLVEVSADIHEIQAAPFEASSVAGVEGAAARMRALSARVSRELEELHQPASGRVLAPVIRAWKSDQRRLQTVRRYVASSDIVMAQVTSISAAAADARLVAAIDKAGRAYARRSHRSLVDATAGSALAILFLYAGFAHFYRRSAAVVRELGAARKREQAVLRWAVEVAEEERMRVARDLHDGPIQKLTALLFRIDLAASRARRQDQGLLAEELDATRAELAREMTEVRRVMVSLRPPALDERGLCAAIEDCARLIFQDTEIICDVTQYGTGEAPSPEVENALFRVAKQSFLALREDAAARRVHVRLATSACGIALCVADDAEWNGDMFVDDSANALQPTALAEMSQRIESVGGTLKVRRSPGVGTEIEATAPLKRRAALTSN